MSSLPVPLSPVMSTLALRRRDLLDLVEEPLHRRALADHLVLRELLARDRLRARASSCAASSTFFTLTSTRSRSSGFSKKSLAPSLMAWTASFTVAWPLMTMIGSVARRLVLADALERLEAAHLGQLHVEDREVDRRVRAREDLRAPARRVSALDDAVALALEHELQRAADVLLVVDDEDRFAAGALSVGHGARG